MKKRMLAYMAAGLILVGVTGLAQAAGYNAREDCCTEGPPYNRDFKQGPAVPTKVVLDQGSRYIEGMGFAPAAEGPKTIVPRISDRCDFCSEGFSAKELETIFHIRKINKIVPAAGN